MEELLQRGIKAVPVTIWGDEVIIGFNPKELARVFKLNSEVSQVSPPAMIEKYETVLVAAGRAARQLPDEYLGWSCPERKRTLGQFTFHIFDRPNRALNAYETGHYNLEDRGRHAEDVLDKVGFEEIAVYGEDVLSRVKHGLTGPAQMDLEKVLETYMGRKTTAELMDLALGHSVHHLKQLYEYMSQAGMEPVDKLEDADFQGVAVPTELF